MQAGPDIVKPERSLPILAGKEDPDGRLERALNDAVAERCLRRAWKRQENTTGCSGGDDSFRDICLVAWWLKC